MDWILFKWRWMERFERIKLLYVLVFHLCAYCAQFTTHITYPLGHWIEIKWMHEWIEVSGCGTTLAFSIFFFSLLRRGPCRQIWTMHFISRHWFGEACIHFVSKHTLTCCSHAKYKLNINQYYDSGTSANLRGIPIYWPALNSYLFFFKPMLSLRVVTGSMISWISSRAASSSFWVGLEVSLWGQMSAGSVIKSNYKIAISYNQHK